MLTAGIDVGSTYTKAALVEEGGCVVSTGLCRTGFRLAEAAADAFAQALERAGVPRSEVAYVVSTGYGRYQVPFRNLQVTDLTAQARGTRFFFPATRTVLDVGGQTMKAARLDERGRVRSFRLNDKCAAGTGAFVEKTARYLGYEMEAVGPLLASSRDPVPISSVCAVFAESEVINHLSQGREPADILHGAVLSLVGRSVQLMRRVQMEPEFTLVGGLFQLPLMVQAVREALGRPVNVPPEPWVQHTAAIGAALLAWRRLQKLAAEPSRAAAGGRR